MKEFVGTIGEGGGCLLGRKCGCEWMSFLVVTKDIRVLVIVHGSGGSYTAMAVMNLMNHQQHFIRSRCNATSNCRLDGM